ncbi:MAG: eukaryotic peptide chain release factor GTP-binding subunit [Amphiamblys sp. WSBS2006]|nr:MAG: eukaryotic peptide chain release factor GTP-binding subunit [Amphiamblys sp. WSBS2006]
MEELSSNLETLSIQKEPLSVVLVGHVDAGKSTIGGHLLFLCGMIDKRTLEKYERESKEINRESWFWTWALDTSTEEREKGITVETAKACIETATKRITVFDAPGHKSYVPSMISGAAQADTGILVISARKGEFEAGFEKSGQTREHASLLRVFGVEKLIVVVNKMDEETVLWSEARYRDIVERVTVFLKQCEYKPKTDLTFIPVSGFTGANLKDKTDRCPWYKGDTLLGVLDKFPAVKRDAHGEFMFAVSGKYKESGLVVTGKVESGAVGKGDTVLVLPGKKKAEVVGIAEEDTEKESARAGENVSLRLKGAGEEDLCSGSMLCGVRAPIECGSEFEVRLCLLNIKNILTVGFSAVLHTNSAAVEVRVAELVDTIDKTTRKRAGKRPAYAMNSQTIICRLSTEREICYTKYSVCAGLGRFTLRDEHGTIAFGKIV